MLTKEAKVGLLVVIVLCVSSFAVGRYTTPVQIKTETKIVEVEKKTNVSDSDKKKERHKKTTTIEETLPDGTKRKTTVVTDDTQSDSQKHDSSSSETSKSETDKKEVTNRTSLVTISALGGASISLGNVPLIYGASITKPVLGPITIGIWGLSNSTAGLSLGLSF